MSSDIIQNGSDAGSSILGDIKSILGTLFDFGSSVIGS